MDYADIIGYADIMGYVHTIWAILILSVMLWLVVCWVRMVL